MQPTDFRPLSRRGAANPREPFCGSLKSMAQIIGLEEFELNLKELLRLKPRRIVYSIQVRTLPIRRLIPLPPGERKKAIRIYLRSALESLQQRYPSVQLRPRDAKLPWTIDAVSDASALAEIAKCRIIDHLMIKRISGRTKRLPPAGPSLYAIQARIAVQVEDQTRGMQLMENSIVVVKA